MKRFALFVFVATLFSLFAAIFSYAADDAQYSISNDGKYSILTSYKGNAQEYEVASEYAGLPVTRIASGAFSGNVSTYKIVIPSNIEYIEPGAFSGMPSLYEFEASGSYKTVDGALYSKDGKTLIRYPQARTGSFSVPSGVTLADHSFSGCMITSVDLSGAVSIGDYAFYMSALESVSVSSPAGEYAFAKSGVVTASVTSGAVGAYAFSGCEKLEYADISGAEISGEGIFSRDTALLAVCFPQSASEIPDLTFSGCTSLVTAPVGAGVRRIGRLAFCGCVSLCNAVYSDSVSAALDAFELCDDLTVTAGGSYRPVSVGSAKITMKTGESLIPTVSAQGGYDLFTSSCILSIDGASVTALSEGSARVYAVSRCGGDCRVIDITVNDGAQVVGSDHPYTEGTYTYTYTVPGSPSRIAVTFSGSDMLNAPDTLTVSDANGNVYGIFSGNDTALKTLFIDGATVRFTLIAEKGGAYGFRAVSVVPVSSLSPVRSITVPSSVSIERGEVCPLGPQAVPAGAFPSELVCVSSDKNVVCVSSDGTMTGVGAGSADITVYSPYYGVKAVCRVTVTDNSENGFSYGIKDGEAVITGYSGTSFFCVIPDTIGGYPVTGIGDSAFAFSSVRTVRIPSGVRNISVNAFDGCFSLDTITVDDNNTEYSSYGGALYSKDRNTLFKVPAARKGVFTVPDSVTQIGRDAFTYCCALTGVELGSGISEIDAEMFAYCDRLYSVTSSGAFRTVDGVLFSSDGKKLVLFPPALNVHSYSVPAGTETVEPFAFNNTVYLTTVMIPTSVTEISDRAFSEALSIEKFVVNSSNTVYSSTDGVLYENGAVKCVPKAMKGVFTVPQSVTRIAPYSFCNCFYLTDIAFNSKTADIGAYAFKNCTSLYRIYLPVSLRKLGEDPFSGCSGLYVYIPDGTSVVSLSDCTVLCGKDSHAYAYCRDNGIPTEFMYYSAHGLYTVYSPVNGTLRVTEDKDKVYLSSASTAAGMPVKAYSVDIVYDDVNLPAGEYVMFRERTSSDRCLLHDKELVVIGDDAESRYLYRYEHIIEDDGDPYTPKLSVKIPPDKTDYNENDEIDTTGLVLYYTGADGVTVIVTEGYTVEYDTSAAGVREATVSYADCSTSFGITVSSAVLTGTVRITGDPRYGTVLSADMSDVLPKTDSVTYQWLRDGKSISGATSRTYTPTAEDIGKKLSVKLKGVGNVGGELTSPSLTVGKAKAQTPPKPVIESESETSVTLKAVEGCEYRLNSDGEFTDSPIFTDLTPGAAYIFYQRYKETDTTEASAISAASHTMPEILKIRSDVYFLNTANGAASLVKPGTNVKEFLKNFIDGDKLKVYKNGDEITGSALVGTGCEVRLYSSGNIADRYTVIVTGDVNGDGKTTITDYLQIKERILNAKEYERPREYACDVNGDGKITITDYLKLKYCIQNGTSPEQNRY